MGTGAAVSCSSSAVAPASTSLSPTTELSYELINVHELPTIDITRSVKAAICTTRGARRYNAVVRASIRFIKTFHVLSLPCDAAMFFVHESTGRWLALVKVVFQTPLAFLTLATLRTDMLKCLLRTYEFWFMSIMNVATCAIYCAYFRDLRAAAMVVYGLGVFSNICVDGNLQSRQLAVTVSMYILYQLVLTLAVALELTPNTHHFALLEYKGRAITSDDFLLNSLSMITILTVRTAYRKRQFLKRTPSAASVSHCVTYRCRVKLQVKDLSAPSSQTVCEAATDGLRASNETTAPQQLRFSSNGVVFLESDVMSRRMFNLLRDPSERVRKWRAIALYATGICGLVFNLFPFVTRTYSFHGNRLTAFSAFALACTLSFIGVFASCYNRKLLRELVLSFDFCFLSLQLLVVHVFACDVFYWDGRCYFVLFNWLAMHWVLTLDALTPKMRRSLGLNIRFAIPVVVFFVLAIMRISLDMVVLKPSRPFQDRLLVEFDVLGRHIEVRVWPFLINRAWTLLLWCFRVLWRLCTSGADDRIIIQGNVELATDRRLMTRTNMSRKVSVEPSSAPVKRAPPQMRKQSSIAALSSAIATPLSRWVESDELS